MISIGFSVNYAQDDSACKGTALCITETVSQVIDGDTIHANVAALKQYQMYIMISVFTVHLEHIKNLNKLNCDGRW